MTSVTSTLHSGVLHKCGGKVKSWTRRWMVLRSDLTLSYYKDATKPPLGIITLKDPSVAVRVGQRADCNWPKNSRIERSMVLTTTKRRFYFFAESMEEAQEWLTHLQAAVEKATGQPPASSNTVPARLVKPIHEHSPTGNGSFRPVSARFADDSPLDIRKAMASELALPESAPNRYVPKQYKPKVKRQVTRRLNDDSDCSGAESASDDDDFNGILATGELDPNEFERKHPVIESFDQSFSITKFDADAVLPATHESLYDVARNPDDIAPVPGNSNNNNGGQDEYEPMDRPHASKPAATTSSTNIHESLYDLVGKINAGEVTDLLGQGEGHSRTQSLTISSAHPRNSSSSSGFSVALQSPLQMDTYESIQEQAGMTIPRASVVNQPLPPIPQVQVAQSLPAHALSSPPPAFYEPVGNLSPLPANFYEEVEKGNSARLEEALSSDDESSRHRLSQSPSPAVGPALPPKSAALTPPPEDKPPARPPPALPPRNEEPLPPPPPPLTDQAETCIRMPPMRPPLRENAPPSNPNAIQQAIYDEVTTESALRNGHADSGRDTADDGQDIYDDATSVPTGNGTVNQDDIYDDATSVPASSEPPRPALRSKLTGQHEDRSSQSAETKPACEEGTGAKASPGKVRPCPLPRKKRTASQGSGSSPEVTPRDTDGSVSSSEGCRVSSQAPASPADTGKGMELFLKRGREMSEVERRDETKNRVVSMLFTGGESQDVSMATIAETLREFEQEKQMASEERFRFERERRRLEEEKKEMEEEKREIEREKERLREELERARALLNAGK